MRPLFSIIIPAYRSRDKIKATVQSVLSQDFHDLECLVMDGDSKDGTFEEVEGLVTDPRFQWSSEPDTGIYDAMNRGIRRATGKFLYFLGAGDILRPGVLTSIATAAKEKSRPDFLYGDVYWASLKMRYNGPCNLYKLLRHNICHQAIFYHRSLFDRFGLFDERFRVCADYAFNLRCFAQRGVRRRYIDLIVADFEGGGVSATRDSDLPFYDGFDAVVRETAGFTGYQMHKHYQAFGRLYDTIEKVRAKVGRRIAPIRRKLAFGAVRSPVSGNVTSDQKA